MSESLSQALLLAIVHGLRRTCKKIINCENFTVMSGFLSCDVDGKAKHRFVINELIGSDNNGEGHSSCLKVIDWSCLRENITSHRNEKTCQQSNANTVRSISPTRNWHQEEDQVKSQFRQTRSKTKQTIIEKCLSGPVSQTHFPRNRTRMSNQTFTLEDLNETPKVPECDLKRNFSSATISIASRQISPDRKVVPEMDSVPKCPRYYNIRKATPSSGLPVRTLYEESKGHCSVTDVADVPYFQNNFSGQLRQEGNCSQARGSSNTALAKLMAAGQRNNIHCKGNKWTQKLSRTGSNHLKRQCIRFNSKRNAKQVVKLQDFSNSYDSDVSIDAIRPRYLVKHNNDLLLPCPNLSSKYKHLAMTKNNNRAHYMCPSSKSCEEGIQNASHISTLFSSIIGALSYSNYTNMYRGFNNKKCDISVNLSEGKLKKNGKVAELSNDSLKSVSSLETDSLKSSLSNAADTLNERSKIFTKKMADGKNSDSKETEKKWSLLLQTKETERERKRPSQSTSLDQTTKLKHRRC